MTLVEDLVEHLADMTLIDEHTNCITMSILTDDVNKEIPSNMTMQVASPGGQVSN